MSNQGSNKSELKNLAGKEILVVSYHFYPSSAVGAKRPSELVKALQRKGAKVTILRCRNPMDGLGKGIQEIGDAYYVDVSASKRRLSKCWGWLKGKRRTKAVDASRLNQAIGFGRGKSVFAGCISKLREIARSYEALFNGEKSWLIRALVKSFFLRRKKIDIVFVSGPVSCAHALGYILARRHSSRLILDFRDPWHVQGDADTYPERAGHTLAIWESKVRQQVVEFADLITVASPGIKRHLLRVVSQDLPEIRLIHNGFDPEMLIREAPPLGSLRMLYSGTLYLRRNPFPLFEAIKQLISTSLIERTLINLKMVGDCDQWEGRSTAEWVKENELDDVIDIVGPVSSQAIREMTIESNVLINLAQGQPDQIPAKSYEYLASGRDVLLFAEEESDSARIFRGAGRGEVVKSDDLEEIKKAILRQYKQKCRDISVCQSGAVENLERYSRVAMNQQFMIAIESILRDAQVKIGAGR